MKKTVEKAILFFSLLSLAFFFLLGCKSDVKKSEVPQAVYKKISAAEAKKMIAENTSAIIVDVRTKSEYDEKHIQNAVLIPLDYINKISPKVPLKELPDYNALILVYCRSGNRSAVAAKKLIALGYTNIYDFGGIADYLNQ